jgi:hypothetical protein
MGRLPSGVWQCVIAVVLAGAINGCGGHKPPGVSTQPARITLTPTGNTSVQMGTTLAFTASAQNAAGTTVSASFVYQSSDTSILNISPNGVACAGVWDAQFTSCTPAGIGVVQVTATGGGASSVPTFVFVHPAIDNITVTGVLLNNVPVQEPCLSQGQSMSVEAHAFSQGADITSAVGPFTWSANNPSVVHIVPIVNLAFTFATNQATVNAVFPGITEIYATASGVTSTSFQQPLYSNAQGNSPVLDFFETCPIQNITLEVGEVGSQQTSFSITKGTPQNVVATLTDVMGNSSLPNTTGSPQLSKIPLTWSSSQPGVVAASTSCIDTCSLSTPSPGAAAVTASCSPPTCNIGFPFAPAVLSSSACAQFFQIASCKQFIPGPVYASPICIPSGTGTCLPNPTPSNGAISGLVVGAPTIPSAIATSRGCSDISPNICGTALYSVSLAKATVGTPSFVPVNPNSFRYTLAGDRIYIGSDFGAQSLNPSNLGSTNPAFTPLSTVTGKILAVSTDGNFSIFADTLHVPNQVYVVGASNVSAVSFTPLSINNASAAAFSPDGLKAFIFGFDSNNNPNLYVYSAQQALQVIPLPAQTNVSSIAFSTNAAFAYVVESSNGAAGPAVSVYNTCNNQPSSDGTLPLTPQVVPLTAAPLFFRVLPDGEHFLVLENGGSLDYITATVTGLPVASLTGQASSTSLCPMTVSHTVRNLNLQQGAITPINLFPSADGSLLYVLASDRGSVLVYDFSSNSISGIQLIGNANPVAGDISVDDGTIVVAASDGLLHQITTSTGGSDQLQLSFPNLPDLLNPFCNLSVSNPCTLDTVLVKP